MSAFSKWCRDKWADEAPGKMDRAYVSDFTHFIDHFLEDHPKEVKEQRTGWRIYWDKQLDLQALEKAGQDSVPDDGYGFYASAFDHSHKH